MIPWFKNKGNQIKNYVRKIKDDRELGGTDDRHFWYRDLEKHSYGELSFAVVQANVLIEDHSQVESDGETTFVGVYDGHGGPEVAKYICDHLFPRFTRHAQDQGTVSEDVLRSVISATEEGFLSVMRKNLARQPNIAIIGSCCLVGVISKGTLYVANVGDSRAVLGYSDGSKKIVAEQLTRDHNVNIEEVRQEVMLSHPDDPQVVFQQNDAWRIKGIIQVSRAIGDAYLKLPELSNSPLLGHTKLGLPEPLRRPILTAEPTTLSRGLERTDKFLIFASDGLWDHMTNEEAAEIVHKNPRRGIARRLLKKVLTVAAKKSGRKYGDIKKVEEKERRTIHDDITIVVVFIDDSRGKKTSVPERLSIRGFMLQGGSSNT